MDKTLTIIMVILMGIVLAIDSFTYMMARGSQQVKISWSWFFKRGTFLVIMQAIFIKVGNIIGFYISGFENTWSHLLTILNLIFALILLTSYFFRWNKGENYPEEVVTSLSFKEFFKLSLAVNLDALLAGLIIGLQKFEISILISLAIAVVSLLTSIIGVQIGYKYGMEKYKITHTIGVIIVIITIILIAIITMF